MRTESGLNGFHLIVKAGRSQDALLAGVVDKLKVTEWGEKRLLAADFRTPSASMRWPGVNSRAGRLGPGKLRREKVEQRGWNFSG